jgi:hypothetical protein
VLHRKDKRGSKKLSAAALKVQKCGQKNSELGLTADDLNIDSKMETQNNLINPIGISFCCRY